MLQLHGIKKPVPEIYFLKFGAPAILHGPRRRHRLTLLGSQDPEADPTRRRPHPRVRSQRHVAILRHRGVPRPQFQRLRAGPGVLRRVGFDPARPERGVPGGVRDAGAGGQLGGEDGGGGPQLRRLRCLQHGGAVPGVCGEGGDMLRWGVLGGEGYEGGVVSGGGCRGSRRHSAAPDGGEDEGVGAVHIREAAQGIAFLFVGGLH